MLLSNRVIIRCVGSDVAKFLNNLTCSDLNKCNNQLRYTLMLNADGRYLYDMFIVNCDGVYYLDVNYHQVEDIIAYMNYMKLISDVHVECLNDYGVLVFQDMQQYHQVCKYDDLLEHVVVCSADCRLENLGIRVLVNHASKFSVLEMQHLDDWYTKLRYQNAIPEGHEMISGKTIPIEYGMDELGVLCYNKGCYIGQEFTNSAKHRLAIRKRVVCLHNISDSQINCDDGLVTSDNKQIGKIIGVHQPYALALIKMQYAKLDLYVNTYPVEQYIPNWIIVYEVD